MSICEQCHSLLHNNNVIPKVGL
ncbi:hypothetical protein NXX23_26475 [Bacteroides ovatus]|nr:hypothetical protein [Bacteroides ovatus]